MAPNTHRYKKHWHLRYPLLFEVDDCGGVKVEELKCPGLSTFLLFHTVLAVEAFHARHVAKIVLEFDEVAPDLTKGGDAFLLFDQRHQIKGLAKDVGRNILQRRAIISLAS